MLAAQLAAVLRHVRRLALPPDTQGLTDVQLLERFAQDGEGPAFAALRASGKKSESPGELPA